MRILEVETHDTDVTVSINVKYIVSVHPADSGKKSVIYLSDGRDIWTKLPYETLINLLMEDY